MATPTEDIKYIKYMYLYVTYVMDGEGGRYKKICTCVMGDVGGVYSVLEYDTRELHKTMKNMGQLSVKTNMLG